MKALVGAFNQEKSLVGAFSVIVKAGCVTVGSFYSTSPGYWDSDEQAALCSYGGRATTTECPTAIVVMCVQSVLGIFIEACMTGIVFAKFTKPAHRGKTILFSDQALVTMRNGAFYLLCRVGDLRPTHLIGCSIYLLFYAFSVILLT